MMLLEIKNVTKKFGGTIALDNLSIQVQEGDILGVIGPNGAGKTTLFNVICGIYRPDIGEVLFRTKAITKLAPHEITAEGIGRTFQTSRIFQRISVLENMLVPMIDMPSKADDANAKASRLLEFVGLEDFCNKLGGELSIGQQKLLEFARVLMRDPELILLDEPFAGVNPAITIKMSELIQRLHGEKKTFLVVSHDIPHLMELSKRVAVLASGRLIAEGPPQEVSKEASVVEAYLGV